MWPDLCMSPVLFGRCLWVGWSLSWSEARDACLAGGGRLASPIKAYEVDIALAMFQNISKYVLWFDLKREFAQRLTMLIQRMIQSESCLKCSFKLYIINTNC